MGRDLITISPAEIQYLPSRGEGWFFSKKLQIEDVDIVREHVGDVKEVAPVVERYLSTQFQNREMRTMIQGVTTNFLGIKQFELEYGEFFSEADSEQKKRVAVIGSFVASKLNSGYNMVNEKLLIDGVPFVVIGLSDAGTNYDDLILVPIKTANDRVFRKDYIDRILVKANAGVDTKNLLIDLSEVLRDSHKLDNRIKNDFTILQQNTSDIAKETTNTLLGGLAIFFTGITLLAGSIGILSVSFLNVLDRKGEIGLRVALGATRGNILLMILMESTLLSLLGGLLGLLMAGGLIYTLDMFTQWEVGVDWSVIAMPFVLSVFLGLVFGLIPAQKAANLQPVEALRQN
jgi:putative ABC transport system permease protein